MVLAHLPWWIEVFDALRWLTIAEGVALCLIGSVTATYAWQHAWPPNMRYGLLLRWVGRVLMFGFMAWFVAHRLHHRLNWYTPVVFLCFTCLCIGHWLTRGEHTYMARHD